MAEQMKKYFMVDPNTMQPIPAQPNVIGDALFGGGKDIVVMDFGVMDSGAASFVAFLDKFDMTTGVITVAGENYYPGTAADLDNM